jgi:glycosyltransferase involved in cell wall biosynthesis
MTPAEDPAGAAPELPLVSVVMPVRNEGGFIQRSLGAVLSQDYPADRMEVIVCDGMSSDATRELVAAIARQHANVRLLDNPGKTAPKALNIGKQFCRGDIIARVDGHCVIAADYIRRCVDHLQRGGIDGVGGPIHTIGQTPTARVIASAMSSKFGVGGSAFRVGNTGARVVDTIAFPVYTRAIMERAGLYDEQLVRNQDDEYNYRLRKLGAKLLLAPDVRSDYYSRGSLRKLARQYFQYGFWKVRVLQKHPLQMRARQFAPLLLVLLLLGLAVASLFSSLAGWLLVALVLAYLAVIAMGSLVTARREHGWHVCLLPAAFVILHLSYGLGFLVGLFRFAAGWLDHGQTGGTAAQPAGLDPHSSGRGAAR